MTFRLKDQCSYLNALDAASSYMEASELWFGHGTDNSWDEAVGLLLWSADLPVETDDSILQEIISGQTAKRFENAIEKRVEQRIPAAYITNCAWFCGLPFYVNESVLVPRSPIAELIQKGYRPWVSRTPESILDLCCGSGCIGIASAKMAPDASVVVSDISEDAIAVAERNIEDHQCHNRVQAVCASLFDGVDGRRFDLILCNPPYVDLADLESMPAEYHHEPEIGLGSGADGLELSREILATAANYLTEEGVLILEVGNSWVHMEKAYPSFPFIWVEFEMGGHGVCVLTRKDLLALNQMRE